jgi:hypothetical protein
MGTRYLWMFVSLLSYAVDMDTLFRDSSSFRELIMDILTPNNTLHI